ncbi:MAG TPA: triose-phosphate isomerase, partial [Candidatus Cryosericum sp.]|nr:triose-phosphate isomerase [Candidatus Cryosericum sp.]
MKIVAGNWKMYKTIDEAQAYVREVAAFGTPPQEKVRAILFPNYVALGALHGSGLVPPWLSLGAQDVAAEAEGAFTGEV